MRHLFPYLIILPGLIFYLLFTVYPIYSQFQISFLHWVVTPGAVSPFVGLANYIQAFHDPVVLVAARNTALYIIATVPPQMILGMIAAYLLVTKIPGAAIWRAAIFLPVITSWVVVSYLFSYLFNSQEGLVNGALSVLLHKDIVIPWLQDTWTANGVIWLLAVWKGIGWSMVVFLAAFMNLPKDQIESARVDGASSLRVWWHVILPSLRPVITFVFVMLVIGGTQAFISIFLMTQGGPANSTQVMLTYSYQQAFVFFNFSYAAAIASIMAVLTFGLSVLFIRVLRERG